MRQPGVFGLTEHLKRLSAHGAPLEELGHVTHAKNGMDAFYIVPPKATRMKSLTFDFPVLA